MKHLLTTVFTFAFLSLFTNPVLAQETLPCEDGDVSRLGSKKYFTMHAEAWKAYLSKARDEYDEPLSRIDNTRGYFISKEALIKILCDSLGTDNEADGVIIHIGLETTDTNDVAGMKIADNKYVKRKIVPYISAAKLNKSEPRPVQVYGSLPDGLPLNFNAKEIEPTYKDR